MFNIGPGELVVILLLALILLGPKRLPDAARAIGKGMREFRKATEDLKGTLEQEIGSLEEPLRSEPPRPAVTESVVAQKTLPAPAPVNSDPAAVVLPTSEPPSAAIPTSEPPSKV